MEILLMATTYYGYFILALLAYLCLSWVFCIYPWKRDEGKEEGRLESNPVASDKKDE